MLNGASMGGGHHCVLPLVLEDGALSRAMSVPYRILEPQRTVSKHSCDVGGGNVPSETRSGRAPVGGVNGSPRRVRKCSPRVNTAGDELEAR